MKNESSVNIKLECDSSAVVKSLEKINKELEKLKKAKIVININTTTDNKKWWQFWK